MATEIRITVRPGGETQVAVQGMAGPGCKSLTAALEAALGETTDDQRTRDYALRESHQATQKAQG